MTITRIRARLAAVLLTSLGVVMALSPTASADTQWWNPTNRPSPDSEINVTGVPATGPAATGKVRGWIDAHTHLAHNEALGGRVVCGKPFSEQGIADALKDCPEHYPDGTGATFENLTGGSPGHHDPVGWPTFKDWPSHKSLTHQQMYYAWIERSWRSGQRILVTDIGSNGVLCSLPVIMPRDRGCDEMDSIRLQAQKTYELQEYVDTMFGGPGRGWFRVVTSPAQATAVINQGKLAVVLGVETSEPFGCKQVLDVAQCSQADIDRGLDELKNLGVSSMYLCHKFDNALCGVRFDPGSLGTIINIGQFLSTGTWWTTEQCKGPQKDNPIGATDPAAEEALHSEVPGYDPNAQCNTRGLTRLGEYALKGMMKRGLMVEVDHMSVKAADRTFEILEAENYPGVLSTHSWMDTNWTERLYKLNGFLASYVFPAGVFAEDAARTAALRDQYNVGLGVGADMNGLGGWPAPEGEASPTAVTYPYKSLDGRATLSRQVTGERTWDVNKDGLAHYGLLPDWLEKVRQAGGAALVNDLMSGAQSYLDTWTGATNHVMSTNLAAGRPATASSSQWDLFTSFAPGNATDGNTASRWASDWSDDQWLRIDLGATRTVRQVTLDWEAAYAKAYRIEVSTDGSTWRTVSTVTDGNGGIDHAAFAATSARYVRVHGVQRATGWGYSLNEVAVHPG